MAVSCSPGHGCRFPSGSGPCCKTAGPDSWHSAVVVLVVPVVSAEEYPKYKRVLVEGILVVAEHGLGLLFCQSVVVDGSG